MHKTCGLIVGKIFFIFLIESASYTYYYEDCVVAEFMTFQKKCHLHLLKKYSAAVYDKLTFHNFE